MNIFLSLQEVANPFLNILLDAYGVFWAGNSAGLLPGSEKAMKNLVKSGKKVGILSNATALSSAEIEKIKKHGLHIDEHFHFMITSGDIARQTFLDGSLPFKTPHKKFWLFGKAHPSFSSHQAIFEKSPFQETDFLHEADFVYISIPHINGKDQHDPEIFRADLLAVKKAGLPMVCVNPDQFAHEGNPPRAVVRQGSIASMYEKMGGHVFYCGKPHPLAFATAFKRFNLQKPNEILMVGDTPETDIRGARNFGMSSALITRTGIMGDRGEGALKNLPPTDLPDFYIERL